MEPDFTDGLGVTGVTTAEKDLETLAKHGISHREGGEGPSMSLSLGLHGQRTPGPSFPLLSRASPLPDYLHSQNPNLDP